MKQLLLPWTRVKCVSLAFGNPWLHDSIHFPWEDLRAECLTKSAQYIKASNLLPFPKHPDFGPSHIPFYSALSRGGSSDVQQDEIISSAQ